MEFSTPPMATPPSREAASPLTDTEGGHTPQLVFFDAPADAPDHGDDAALFLTPQASLSDDASAAAGQLACLQLQGDYHTPRTAPQAAEREEEDEEGERYYTPGTTPQRVSASGEAQGGTDESESEEDACEPAAEVAAQHHEMQSPAAHEPPSDVEAEADAAGEEAEAGVCVPGAVTGAAAEEEEPAGEECEEDDAAVHAFVEAAVAVLAVEHAHAEADGGAGEEDTGIVAPAEPPSPLVDAQPDPAQVAYAEAVMEAEADDEPAVQHVVDPADGVPLGGDGDDAAMPPPDGVPEVPVPLEAEPQGGAEAEPALPPSTPPAAPPPAAPSPPPQVAVRAPPPPPPPLQPPPSPVHVGALSPLTSPGSSSRVPLDADSLAEMGPARMKAAIAGDTVAAVLEACARSPNACADVRAAALDFLNRNFRKALEATPGGAARLQLAVDDSCFWEVLLADDVAQERARTVARLSGTVMEKPKAVANVDDVARVGADGRRTYPLSLLVSTVAWPDDVDPSRRELSLHDDEFVQLFKVDKAAFGKLPGWKQAQQRKQHDLF